MSRSSGIKTAAELFKSDASDSDNCYIDCVENSESGDEAETPKTKRPRPKNIINLQVAAALDRMKDSYSNAWKQNSI